MQHRLMGDPVACGNARPDPALPGALPGGFWSTNTAESYFALLKRGVYGAFHSVSEAHLHRYLAEFDFRYNHRHTSDVEWAEELLRGAKGKRLMYQQPNEAPNA